MLVSGKPVEMLAVLVVLMFLPTWSDGHLLTKCELKSQLEASFSKLNEEIPESTIAKLACTVEQISGFNSNLQSNTDNVNHKAKNVPQKPLQHDNDKDGSSGMGESPLLSLASISESEDYMFPVTGEPFNTLNDDYFSPREDGVQPEETGTQDDGQARNEDKKVHHSDLPPQTTEPPESREHIYYDTYEMLFGHKPWDTTGLPETEKSSKDSSDDQTKRYGIFQLSDTACKSGSSQSQNLCGLDCSALTDDDITDDIACLMTLNKSEMPMEFTQECESVDPSQYFAGCD